MVRDQKINKMLSEIVDKIKNEYQPEKIILFGSYAYGKPNKDSDIDLFIVKETNKRRVDRFVEVSQITHEPKQGISISPVVYTPREVETRLAMGDDFAEEVLNKGEVLYVK